MKLTTKIALVFLTLTISFIMIISGIITFKSTFQYQNFHPKMIIGIALPILGIIFLILAINKIIKMQTIK